METLGDSRAMLRATGRRLEEVTVAEVEEVLLGKLMVGGGMEGRLEQKGGADCRMILSTTIGALW